MSVVLVVMGVSGSGKTTLARRLAAHLGLAFQEGDDLHPAANVAKMRQGIALDDSDRAPWLDRIADWIAVNREGGGVITCSALKRRYRDRLRSADAALRFVFPDVDAATLRRRVAGREHDYMPASLLDSQFDTLEWPEGEGDVIVVSGVDGGRDVAVVKAVLGEDALLPRAVADHRMA